MKCVDGGSTLQTIAPVGSRICILEQASIQDWHKDWRYSGKSKSSIYSLIKLSFIGEAVGVKISCRTREGGKSILHIQSFMGWIVEYLHLPDVLQDFNGLLHS
jgi:hypothetical protein